VNREKALILKEADFKADELIREAQGHVVELETQIRSLKLERVRFLQDMDSLLGRSRRFLQEEAPEMFPSPEAIRKAEEREAARLDPGGSLAAAAPNGPRPPQIPVRKIKE